MRSPETFALFTLAVVAAMVPIPVCAAVLGACLQELWRRAKGGRP